MADIAHRPIHNGGYCEPHLDRVNAADLRLAAGRSSRDGLSKSCEVRRARVQQLTDEVAKTLGMKGGKDKTVTAELGPVAQPRTPTCEEVFALASSMPPGAVERLFGNSFSNMTIEDFDQAINIVSHCRQIATETPDQRFTPPSQRRSVRLKLLSMITRSLASYRDQLVRRQAAERARQEEAEQKRIRRRCFTGISMLVELIRSSLECDPGRGILIDAPSFDHFAGMRRGAEDGLVVQFVAHAGG